MLKRRSEDQGQSSIIAKKWRGNENATVTMMAGPSYSPLFLGNPSVYASPEYDNSKQDAETIINETIIPKAPDAISPSELRGRGTEALSTMIPCEGRKRSEGSSCETSQSPAAISGSHTLGNTSGSDSLMRLFQRRFQWSNREFPFTTLKSAFHEVRNKSLPLCEISTAPYALRKKVDINVRELSDVRPIRPTPHDKDLDCHSNSNHAELVAQPQMSRNHHLMMAHFASSNMSIPRPDISAYSTLGNALVTGQDCPSASAHELGVAEKMVAPFRRYSRANDNNDHDKSISGVSPGFYALSSLALPSAHPLWSPRPLGGMKIPSENWCALCKTGFRMTSDLVYHMRTYHRREHSESACGPRGRHNGDSSGGSGGNKTEDANDQTGKIKVEKILRCHICRETFREKHHMTRHMISHVR